MFKYKNNNKAGFILWGYLLIFILLSLMFLKQYIVGVIIDQKMAALNDDIAISIRMKNILAQELSTIPYPKYGMAFAVCHEMDHVYWIIIEKKGTGFNCYMIAEQNSFYVYADIYYQNDRFYYKRMWNSH